MKELLIPFVEVKLNNFINQLGEEKINESNCHFLILYNVRNDNLSYSKIFLYHNHPKWINQKKWISFLKLKISNYFYNASRNELA